MKTTLKIPVLQRAVTVKTIRFAIAVAFGIAACPAPAQSPLTITCPTNLSLWTCATNPVLVSYPPPIVTGSCPGIITNCTPRSGTFFAVGVTTVRCEATNSCGEHAVCTFTIAVLPDTNAPTIACPSNITVQCLAGVPAPPTTLAEFFAQGGQASDNHALTLTYLCTDGPLSGGTCGGTILRRHTVTDDCTNSASCVQIITVHDTLQPRLTCPTNRSVECGAAWAFETPSATDNCGGSNVVISVLSTVTNGLCGQTFSAIRTWLATDACGNSNTCAQTVTIVDTTPPRLICPSDLVMGTTSSNGAVVTFTVTASDNCDASPTVSSTPRSGSLFPIGTNTVVCAALDGCRNSNSCSFTVTVVPVPRVVSVGSADGRTIGVRFDMELDQVSAESVTNYTVDTGVGGLIVNWSNAVLRPNGREVELTLDPAVPIPIGFSVTASNLSARGYPPYPFVSPIANGQASGRVLRFNTVAFGDPGDRSDVFTCDNQALELTGGGSAPWYPDAGNDDIAFTYRTLTGDFDVAARVGFVVNWSNAVGGLMVRGSLSSTSRMAALVFDPTRAMGVWYIRSNGGGAAQVQGEVPFNTNLCWLRLRRMGDTLTAFAGTNGVDWSVVGWIVDWKEPRLVGFAVGSSQAGEVAGIVVDWFQYRNYCLQLIPMPSGFFGFSWYGPGTVQATSSLSPVIAGWQTSPVPVEQNADERWVIFEFDPQPEPPGRQFFRVVADPF